VSSITVSDLDINTTDYSAWWGVASGLTPTNEIYLQVTRVGDNSIIGVFAVKTITDLGAYWGLSVQPILGSGTLQVGRTFTISWVYNGRNGSSGTSGTSGINGSSGTSGTSGTTGTSGTSGINGSSGSSGSSGRAGSSGTSGSINLGNVYTTANNFNFM
jgi:hypothetical protein